jgi:hypothetical protein
MEYLEINKSSIIKIDAVKSETYKYQIFWDNPNFRYDWLIFYEIPYIIIDNQEDYDYIRYDNAVFIDFNKYVLFVCLITKSSRNDNPNYGNGNPVLDVYYDKEKGITYLRFVDLIISTLCQECEYVSKQVSFLIPRKYYNDTQTVYLNQPMRPIKFNFIPRPAQK